MTKDQLDELIAKKKLSKVTEHQKSIIQDLAKYTRFIRLSQEYFSFGWVNIFRETVQQLPGVIVIKKSNYDAALGKTEHAPPHDPFVGLTAVGRKLAVLLK